jgi:Na+/H+ antiporter NhaC
MIIDEKASGIGHSIIYSITNLFKAIAGHPSGDGLRGVGIMRNAGRAEVVLVVLLLGAFITILEKSGGAYAFGNWLSDKVKTKRGAQNATGIMGCALFTSAYFSSLATGTVFKPIYDRMNISREKLAFILDSTSAPINTLIPISGWVAYMGALMVDNIPEVTDPIKGLTATIPYNFYCIVMLVMVFLFANNVIKDYGPMKKAEEKMLDKKKYNNISEEETVASKDMKDGKVSDMLWPLGVSVIILVILGLWNYTIANLFQVSKVPFGGNQMLILSFSIGMIVAFIKYVGSKIMTAKEFLDTALEGTKSAIIGGMIIILAVTLGDLMRAAAPEGLGTALYLGNAAKGIPSAVIPCIVFILGAFMGFAMGTSWGVWGILMPIAIPLTLAAGGNPFVAAAAVLSGGTFGDHCSPISDTTIMSSIGAGCDHIEHVNTQLPYALTAAGISAVLFLLTGFIF